MTDLEKPITTQEDFDAMIQGRLDRERRNITEKYKDYVSPEDFEKKSNEKFTGWISPDDHKKTLEEKESKINELTQSVKTYETASVKTKIASEFGLPIALASRLAGDTEEDIRKDAETMKSLVGTSHKVPPMAQPEEEPVKKDPTREGLKNALKQIKGE